MYIGILSANVLLADMAVCIRLQIERRKFPACRQAGNLPQDSGKKLFEADEFDSEETVINQKICDKQIGALAEWILCTGVKSRRSWFNSTEHHKEKK